MKSTIPLVMRFVRALSLGALSLISGSASTQANVKSYGALGDGKIADGTFDSPSSTVHLGSPLFTPQDVGKPILLHGFGSTVFTSDSTIGAFVDSRTVKLATPLPTSAHHVQVQWATDDYPAIGRAVAAIRAAGGGTLLFNPGRYLLGSGHIVLDFSNLQITGSAEGPTVLTAFRPAPALIEMAAGRALSQLSVLDLEFDCNEVVINALALTPNTSSVVVSKCHFLKPGSIGIGISGASDVKVNNTLFEALGNATGTGILLQRGASNIGIDHCTFRYLQNGILMHGNPTASADSSMVRDVTITNCHFDLGWWLTVPLFSHSGPSVEYTPTSVVDPSASFAGVAQNASVRVMTPLVNGTGAVTASSLSDPAKNFASLGVRQGDLIEMENVIAVVDQVLPHKLSVEEWLDDSTRLVKQAGSGQYRIYRWLIGKAVSLTPESVTVDAWRDYLGNVILPPAGSIYEMAARPANYSVHAEPGTTRIHVQHSSFLRGYSDQCSIWGLDSEVSDNTIRDGEDMGITLNGANHLVTNNYVHHQGAGGIYIDAVGSRIVNNRIEDTPWVNVVNQESLGEMVVWSGAKNNLISGNRLEAHPSMPLVRFGLVVYGKDAQKPVIGNQFIDNTSTGHLVADFAVIGAHASGNKWERNSGRFQEKGVSSGPAQTEH
jgi:hypothetical protein